MRTDKEIERKIKLTMESLDGLSRTGMSRNLERDILQRLEKLQLESAPRMKWFWVAAVVLFLINGITAFNYLTHPASSSTESSVATTTSESKTSFEKYYYSNSTNWYE